jgi:hypothetical protein
VDVTKTETVIFSEEFNEVRARGVGEELGAVLAEWGAVLAEWGAALAEWGAVLTEWGRLRNK